ncbi:MAG: hypothetical protein ACM3ZB_08670 [bacterium]
MGIGSPRARRAPKGDIVAPIAVRLEAVRAGLDRLLLVRGQANREGCRSLSGGDAIRIGRSRTRAVVY